MRVILVHGMGRSPLSQMILGMRLRARGFAVSYFGYSATFSSFDATVARLVAKLRARSRATTHLPDIRSAPC